MFGKVTFGDIFLDAIIRRCIFAVINRVVVPRNFTPLKMICKLKYLKNV